MVPQPAISGSTIRIGAPLRAKAQIVGCHHPIDCFPFSSSLGPSCPGSIAYAPGILVFLRARLPHHGEWLRSSVFAAARIPGFVPSSNARGLTVITDFPMAHTAWVAATEPYEVCRSAAVPGDNVAGADPCRPADLVTA
jgi:hypothetical protein